MYVYAVVLKRGALSLLSTEGGDVPFELPTPRGAFSLDCRFLDGYTLRLDVDRAGGLSGVNERSVETSHRLSRAGPSDEAMSRHTLAIDPSTETIIVARSSPCAPVTQPSNFPQVP
jgi:hypothetical protein